MDNLLGKIVGALLIGLLVPAIIGYIGGVFIGGVTHSFLLEIIYFISLIVICILVMKKSETIMVFLPTFMACLIFSTILFCLLTNVCESRKELLDLLAGSPADYGEKVLSWHM